MLSTNSASMCMCVRERVSVYVRENMFNVCVSVHERENVCYSVSMCEREMSWRRECVRAHTLFPRGMLRFTLSLNTFPL